MLRGTAVSQVPALEVQDPKLKTRGPAPKSTRFLRLKSRFSVGKKQDTIAG
jgi:hypothetical protein